MLTLAFRFPAGRYHATPWGRHVNEAEVAWPPDAWRLVRALISTWHHKLQGADFDRAALDALVLKLSSEAPHYRLPPGVPTHSRHYMPQGRLDKGREKTSLVFDAFLRLRPDDPLIMHWPAVELTADDSRLLDALLGNLGYLGRAESWVEAERLSTPELALPELNCTPGSASVDTDTGEYRERVDLMKPRSAAAWQTWQARFAEEDLAATKGRKRQHLAATVPPNLTDAIAVDTAQLQQVGWSGPPAAETCLYQRPPVQVVPEPALPPLRPVAVCCARFQLQGKPLPQLVDALPLAEAMRAAACGRAKHLHGADRIPPCLSGHDLPADNRHGHAFYLPEDADGDGRIDHLLVFAPMQLDRPARETLSRLRQLRRRNGGEWHLLLEAFGPVPPAHSRVAGCARRWESVTPYLHPWHRKGRHTLDQELLGQLGRECRLRGLPEPERVERLPDIDIGRGRRLSPLKFRRQRGKRGIVQPDRQGQALRLHFAEPVAGPLALGFACHFGLGLFRPLE